MIKLLLPKILYPALGLPLDLNVILEIDEKEDKTLVKTLCDKGWIEVENDD